MNAAARRLLTAVTATAVVACAQHAAPVVLCLPAGETPRVSKLLRGWFADEIVIESVESLAFAAPAATDARVWLLWDAWTLARAAAAGAQVLAVPFVDELVLVAGPDAAVDGAPTWEGIALAASLHDRLGLVDPGVDGGPWLAAMQQRLQRGESAETGVALWTTLDARTGRLSDSYTAVVEGLAAGRLAAAIGPRRHFDGVLRTSGGRLRATPLPGTCARGLAIAPMASARVRRLADDLLSAERLPALAAAAGLVLAEGRTASLAPATARAWWQRFESHVRGRGRTTERVADVLDVVFGAGFLVAAWFVYRTLRRGPPVP